MSQPTMEDVARAAGVSRALVSLVMRGEPNVSDIRRKAVLESAEELGYRPNVLARNLASRKTMTIGVTINDLHNPFFAEAVDGIMARADELDYKVLLATGGAAKAGESGAIESLLRLRVDGLVLTGPRVSPRELEATGRDTPAVLLGRRVRTDQVDSVTNDEHVGARLVVDHLAGLGHNRISHVDGGNGAGAATRRAGYERAMVRAGLEQYIDIVGGSFTEDAGAAGASVLLSRKIRPTAIFAANDVAAIGVRNQIEADGYSVPDDFSVVGYDNTALAAMRHTSLTTIDQPREEMGRLAFDILFERMNGRLEPRRDVVIPTLVVRSSSGAPNT